MELFYTNLKIEEQYDEWISPDVVCNLDEAKALLDICIGEMDYFIRVGIREIGKDQMQYVKASFLNVFRNFVSGITNPQAIKADIKVIKAQVDIARFFGECEQELLDTITESNYQEVIRLGSFCYSSYVDIEQEMLLCQKAIYYDIDSEIVPEYDSSMISGFIQTTSLFRTFFEEQLDSLKKAESVEKIKKL